MPYVNIKYQLTLDATVKVESNHLFFQGEQFTPANTTGGDNLPMDKIYVADKLTIDMLLSGGVGQWTIAIWIVKLDPFDNTTQIGGWKPIANNGTNAFTNDVSVRNSLLGDYLINW